MSCFQRKSLIFLNVPITNATHRKRNGFAPSGSPSGAKCVQLEIVQSLVNLSQSFYSILVRLKGYSVLTCGVRTSGFYSRLVRLKAVTLTAWQAVSKFLFHTGSIKRRNNNCPNGNPNRFYSILVRLKVYAEKQSEED